MYLLNHFDVGGGFQDCLFSLPGEMIQFDQHAFSNRWFNCRLLMLSLQVSSF